MAELPLSPTGSPADLTSSTTVEAPSPPADSTPAENLTLESSPPCPFFLEGRCRFGARCRNLHSNNTGNSCNLEDRRPASQDPSPSEKKPPMKTAEDVISRLLWDAQVPAERFSIGYLDRFLGTLEEPFTAFSWEDLASAGPGVLAIPKHRIQYFKYGERVVWDKASRTDDVFGSTGGGRTILQVIKEEAAASEAIRGKALEEGGGGTGHPGEVDSLDSEKSSDGAAGGQVGVLQLGEAVENLNGIERTVSDGSAATSEAGGKVVTAGHSEEEAELSMLVLSMKEEREDEENEVSDSRAGRRFPGHKQRPTHFVAIQITSSETREVAGHIQRALCKVRPDLAEFCVPLAALHLTLCLLRLDTPEEIYRAVEALQELQANSRRLLPPALLLSFQGVERFHSRVLYMCPASVAELEMLARTLEGGFRGKDLTVIQPPGKYDFHLTVAKVPPGKLGPQLPADLSWLPPIEDLGTQAVEAICLCEVGQGRKTDGFYNTVLKLDLY